MRDVAFYLIADLSICLLGGVVAFGVIYLSQRLHLHREISLSVVMMFGLGAVVISDKIDFPALGFVGGVLISPLALLPNAIAVLVIWQCLRGLRALAQRILR